MSNKKFVRRLIGLAAGIMLCIPASAQEDLTLCFEGWKQYQAGKYTESLALYESCLAAGRLTTISTANTYRNMGMAFNAIKEHSRAIQHYDKSLALNPPDPWNDHVNRGNAWSSSGDYAKAISDYERALQLRPDLGAVYFNRGIVHERPGNIDKAKADIATGYEKGFRSPQIVERMAYYQLPLQASDKLDPTKPIETTELLSGALMQIATSSNGKATCFEKDLTLADIRPEVQRELSKSGIQKPSLNQAANAFYTLNPCPFSASGKALRVASQNDVEGIWLNPESSQKYRYSPQSPAWQQFRALPVKCESVGFYPNGEMRTARLAGTQVTCQFR